MHGYFICFCVNNMESDGSPQEPVMIPFRADSDDEAASHLDKWKRNNPDYNGLDFAEAPHVFHMRKVA